MKFAALATQITTISRQEALAAGIMAALWLVIIGLLHIIKPELKPSVNMISEYARKPKGWIMQVAFFCMAISCFIQSLAMWPYVSHVGLALLVIIGLGFVGAGAFVTDPLVKQGAATISGTLHNIFSFIAIPLFPIMATIISISMVHNSIWGSDRGWLPTLSVLTWVGFVGFMGSPLYAMLTGKRAPTGYLQRVMVLTYTIWLIVAAIVIFNVSSG